MATVERLAQAVPTAARNDASGGSGDGMPGLLEVAAQELLAVTAWYIPSRDHNPLPTITVRFTGQLYEARPLDPDGEELSRVDRFSCDESFELGTGSGPVALTARVRDLTPGTWSVCAVVLDAPDYRRGWRRTSGRAKTSLPVTPWSFRKRPKLSPDFPLRTRLPLFAVAPGVVPFVWAAMAIIGIAVGLAVQQVLAGQLYPAPGPVLAISLVGIAAGVLGAKLWFIVLHRAEHRLQGWCIQGFLSGFVIAAGIYLESVGAPIGRYLATAAPGLLLGLAIGRVGCFFAGCCAGRPTSSRWGLWSSDQRVGIKRLPTQLMESALALTMAVGTGVAVGWFGFSSGWLFVAAVALYTSVRQAILKFRVEPRQSTVGPQMAAGVALAVFLVAVAILAV